MRRRATARVKAAAALAAAAALGAAGLGACSGGDDKPVGVAKVVSTLGPGEGALNLLTLPGSVESGGTDPRVDWVTPFQERTGCKIGLKVVKTPEEMADLMRDRGRRYDGVAAPPEVAGRLVEENQAVPINPDLVDGYKKLEPRLRKLLERDGKHYGLPYVWGSNLLMYDTRAVPPPAGWAALFDPAQARRYSGKIVMRDSPLAIAEAALYLKGRQRKLKIRDPYSLTPAQLAAAGRVLTRQRPYVGEYWDLPADAVSAFAGGRAVLGQAWPYHADVLNRASRPVQGVIPSEGATGWMDAWMIGARVQHPNCMYQWLQWTASPDVQQQVAEWTGVAPANPQACSGDRLKSGFCAAYHVGDRGYLDKIVFAHAPSKTCGGESGKKDCTDYAEWTRTWIQATKA
ncbi:putative spermidine/putrescine transport system substrate-binding protein [Actinomadura coerulea]|uniref:Putative spermidine/putrescine transport system substrate-binding protein n=1 Tax=Actinomadura coerulea TaxID=46159 RepID=A0A7X0FTL0_9ACTN|nr:ABC transporter substrate-binding protein [Actinomadura coerulea]MBB6393284.1 putative spermidine/putrescine transport system substrate-binding protein [Actinomadura coerulea]GGQ37619.1 spermidine/putrescine ABC transporter substrate-binding protein [Actinomadura coerulea]